MRISALLVLSLIFSRPAHAVEFGVLAGSHIGAGLMGDKVNPAYQTRTVGVFDLQAMPGLKFFNKALLAGLLFDLRLLSQIDDVGMDAGNFGGTGLLLGPGLVFDFSVVRLFFSYDMRARASISIPDATLKGSGIHLLLGYKARPSFSIDLEYVRTRYNTIALSALGTEADLSQDPVVQNNFGFGVSFLFF